MPLTYEILALRYGILDGGRLQYQNYIIPDDHLAPDPLDFLVFAIRGPIGAANPQVHRHGHRLQPGLRRPPRARAVAHAGSGAARRRHRPGRDP